MASGLTDSGQLFEVQTGAGLTQQVQSVIEQLGAGSSVQVLQVFHWDLWLDVHYAQDERCVLDLGRGAEGLRVLTGPSLVHRHSSII